MVYLFSYSRSKKDYLWPIPYVERKTNPSLIQNPYWE
ncbi:RagB/SusD family nutrient uptake outer membrane protein [Parapedobacter sp.]